MLFFFGYFVGYALLATVIKYGGYWDQTQYMQLTDVGITRF
jgi:hypothetical protein